jgi:hypothetical protein
MKKYFTLLIFIIYGCGASNNSEIEKFKNKTSSLIVDSNSIEVIASELSDFKWDSLCFQRKSLLQLTFFKNNSTVVQLKLDYRDYFIDEPYVKGSLDGKCISNKDHILIKKKYPGYAETIEFMFIKR